MKRKIDSDADYRNLCVVIAELNRFCEGVVISQGGVIPQIHPALYKKRNEWTRFDTAINPAQREGMPYIPVNLCSCI